MKYSPTQARKVAQQIHDRFAGKIIDATLHTVVPEFFVAGLIGVEAGKDRNGQIKKDAARFEPGVYSHLVAVRAAQRRSWSGITTADLKDKTVSEIRALSQSYGLLQVMGWHCVHNLGCTVDALRSPETHLKYAVKLLAMNGSHGDFQRKEYAGELREWNSGSETGKTYDPDYVFNATAVMTAYQELSTVLPTEVKPAVEPEIPLEPSVETSPKPSVFQQAKTALSGMEPESRKSLLSVFGSKVWAAICGLALYAANNPFKIIVIGLIAAGGFAIIFYYMKRQKDKTIAQIHAAESVAVAKIENK